MGRPARKAPRIKPLSNIHREPGAWVVLVSRKRQAFQDYFADGVWGGRALALVAAQRFRDELLTRIDPDIRVRRKPARGHERGTGVVGVSLERHVRGGRRVPTNYVANWRDPEKGVQRQRFSLERHGKAHALALAIAARQAGVARSHAYLLERQREEASQRLQRAPSMPRQVKDPRSRKGLKQKVRRNSSTGVAGVTLLPKGRGWRATPAYCARWVDGSGVRVSRTFAVSKYGKRGALKLAVRAKREGMKRASEGGGS